MLLGLNIEAFYTRSCKNGGIRHDTTTDTPSTKPHFKIFELSLLQDNKDMY